MAVKIQLTESAPLRLGCYCALTSLYVVYIVLYECYWVHRTNGVEDLLAHCQELAQTLQSATCA